MSTSHQRGKKFASHVRDSLEQMGHRVRRKTLQNGPFCKGEFPLVQVGTPRASVDVELGI